MTPAEIAIIMSFVKFGTDMAVDAYIDLQQQGYTPDQLKAMIESEVSRKKILDANWAQMVAEAKAESTT